MKKIRIYADFFVFETAFCIVFAKRPGTTAKLHILNVRAPKRYIGSVVKLNDKDGTKGICAMQAQGLLGTYAFAQPCIKSVRKEFICSNPKVESIGVATLSWPQSLAYLKIEHWVKTQTLLEYFQFQIMLKKQSQNK